MLSCFMCIYYNISNLLIDASLLCLQTHPSVESDKADVNLAPARSHESETFKAADQSPALLDDSSSIASTPPGPAHDAADREDLQDEFSR